MSIFRNTVWFLKGLKEYTANGYTAASATFKERDLEVDCSGKCFMITGCNSGIGKQTALEISKRGGTIHMVCRNLETSSAARDELMKETGNSEIHLHILDMSRPTEVTGFVKKFVSNNERLDVLVNNAGCMINTRDITEDNLDKNFATNSLGTFLLTTGLQPLLEKSDSARVVTVSSGGMLVQKMIVDDLQFEKMRGNYDGTMAYAQNKRQQVEMTEEWATKFPGIHFSSMHPGWADTPAVRSSMPDFYNKMKDKLRTVEQGADTVVWLAVSEAAISAPSGQFWQDRTPVSTHLPLAWTRSSQEDKDKLMKSLADMKDKFTVL